MIIPSVEVETCGEGETLHFPNHVIDEWKRSGRTTELFVELSEVSDEPDASVLLRAE